MVPKNLLALIVTLCRYTPMTFRVAVGMGVVGVRVMGPLAAPSESMRAKYQREGRWKPRDSE